MGLILWALAGLTVVGLLISSRGRASQRSAGSIAVIYFLVTTFTIVGNPFAEPKTATVPIFGILLTLPWSLVAARFMSSVTLALETSAVLNAVILFFLLARWSAPKPA